MENVVYWGMDWLCPGYSLVLSEQLTRFHGNITIENSIQYITAITQTGDLRIFYYLIFVGLMGYLPMTFVADIVLSDLTNQKMYIAYAAASYETGPVCYPLILLIISSFLIAILILILGLTFFVGLRL